MKTSLFQAALFRKYDFVVSELKHLTYQKLFPSVVYHLFTFNIDGDIGKFVQISVILKLTKL